MRHVLSLILLLTTSISYGQRGPQNIDEAINVFISTSSDSIKNVIRNTKDASLIDLTSRYDMSVKPYQQIKNWSYPNDSVKIPMVRYYAKQGITYPDHIQDIILRSIKNYLTTGKTGHSDIIKPFQEIEKKWNAEDKIRYTTDTLRGDYIPKDLNECLNLIDIIWSDSVKRSVIKMTEKDFVGGAHMGFGTWMRNNWHLWGGSRLTKYFGDLGVYNAESISGIILVSYQRHLKALPIDLDGQIQKDKNYWKATAYPTKKMFPKGEPDLKFNTGFFYEKKNGEDGLIHIGTNSKAKKIWLYDYYFGWKAITNEQLRQLDQTKMEQREDVLIEIFKKL